MEMSVRKARAGFAAALSAAERGERVVITKNGKAVAELGPPTVPAKKRKLDLAELERIQEELGIPKPTVPLDDEWLERFNNSDDLFGPEYR